MKKQLYSLFFCLSLVCPLIASSNDDLLNGLDAYIRSDWASAITSFEHALHAMPSEKKEILYWLVMTHTSAHNYDTALGYADAFLSAYPADENAAEVLYQKGRILHLYDRYAYSNDILFRFLKEVPEHPKVPSAYYWIGENLYAEQKLPAAREAFLRITIDYPESGKLQAAQQRLDEIDAIQSQTNVSGEAAEVPAMEPIASESPSMPPAADDTDMYEVLYNKIETLEYKIDQLTEAFLHYTKTQDTSATDSEENRKQKELAALKEKARILEELYEKRVKGEKTHEK
ncbi:MAG: tetratricopeptide repeat protein [Treponema sp.]